MAIKIYSAFPKAPALPEPHHQIILCHIQDTHWGKSYPFCSDAVDVFYSPSRLREYDWVGKVIHRESCKRFKFDHADK